MDITRRRLILVVRAVLLLLVVALTLASDPEPADIAVLLLLVVVAAAASIPIGNETVQRWQPTAEAILACLLMLALDPLPEAMMPYLLAPALAAGLIGGFRGGVTTSGLAVLTLVLGRATGDASQTWSSYLGTVSQWGLITLAVGLLGWVGAAPPGRPGGSGERRLRRGVPPVLAAADGVAAAVRRPRPGHARPGDARARAPLGALRPGGRLRAVERRPADPDRLRGRRPAGLERRGTAVRRGLGRQRAGAAATPP